MRVCVYVCMCVCVYVCVCACEHHFFVNTCFVKQYAYPVSTHTCIYLFVSLH